mgnify:CR=1 FL=1
MLLVKNIDYFIMDPPQNSKITIDEISPAFIEYYCIRDRGMLRQTVSLKNRGECNID